MSRMVIGLATGSRRGAPAASAPAYTRTSANSGRYFASGSSSWNLPCSKSCISATPVIGLVIEKICAMASRDIGRPASRSAMPNAPKYASRPFSQTSALAATRRPDETKAPSVESMRAFAEASSTRRVATDGLEAVVVPAVAQACKSIAASTARIDRRITHPRVIVDGSSRLRGNLPRGRRFRHVCDLRVRGTTATVRAPAPSRAAHRPPTRW